MAMPAGTVVSEVIWRLPEWIEQEIELARVFASDEDKMGFVIDLAARNVARGGGPFGAAVFDARTGAVFSVGVNCVLAQRSSLLHAEIAAIAFAQARAGSYTLSGGEYELVTSSEPCAQCLGAACWSGVRRLVCGAAVADAEAVGFDEGPRRDDWVRALEKRGLQVRLGVRSAEAKRVLEAYAAAGGPIYNGLRSS